MGSGFNDTALLHLTNALRNNSSIKSLYISENITLAGWNGTFLFSIYTIILTQRWRNLIWGGAIISTMTQFTP